MINYDQVEYPPQTPPWNAFSFPMAHLDWRTVGQFYLEQHLTWYRCLEESEVEAYIADYPEPVDWRHWYEFVRLSPNDVARKEEIQDIFVQMREDRESLYLPAEYQRGLACEERGELLQAMRHFRNVFAQDLAKESEIVIDAAKRFERVRKEVMAQEQSR